MQAAAGPHVLWETHMAFVRALALIALVCLAAAGEAARSRRHPPHVVIHVTNSEAGDTSGTHKP
jgi:hypothetical protein